MSVNVTWEVIGTLRKTDTHDGGRSASFEFRSLTDAERGARQHYSSCYITRIERKGIGQYVNGEKVT